MSDKVTFAFHPVRPLQRVCCDTRMDVSVDILHVLAWPWSTNMWSFRSQSFKNVQMQKKGRICWPLFHPLCGQSVTRVTSDSLTHCHLSRQHTLYFNSPWHFFWPDLTWVHEFTVSDSAPWPAQGLFHATCVLLQHTNALLLKEVQLRTEHDLEEEKYLYFISASVLQ